MAASRLRGGEEVLKLLQHVGFPNQLTFFQHFGYLLPMFLESLKKKTKKIGFVYDDLLSMSLDKSLK